MDHARAALQSGQSRIVRYDATSNDDILFGTGLGCKGVIDVLIEPVSQKFRVAFGNAVENCAATRQNGAMATLIMEGNAGTCFTEHAFQTADENWVGRENLASVLNGRPVETDKTTLLEEMGDGRIFIQPLLSPIQLVIFGGWLDITPLIRFAKETGFRVIVVDARQRPSSRKLFHEADMVLLCSPAEALAQIQMDARTAVVSMNHHLERDQEALSAFTQAPHALYIGTLGPKRRQEQMITAAKKDGFIFTDEFMQKLHGPAGLDIGAKSPEEIALSIMAEILSVLNARNAAPMRERTASLQAVT
jgi:xanthine/CO dehydrogenase XdhC/CoxF family maturation factor